MHSYLDDKGLPVFDQIDPNQIRLNLEELLDKANEQIASVCAEQTADWNLLVGRLENILSTVEREWSPVRHLNSVMQTEALRVAYADCLPLLTEFYTDFSQNRTLYNKYKLLNESESFQELDVVQQKIVKDALRDFKLAGINLQSEKQKQVKGIRRKLAELENHFRDQVLDSTQAWSKHITNEQLLEGIPESGKQLLQMAAEQRNLPGWVVTLDLPHYLTVMSHATNVELRKETYHAYMTRASAETKWNNGRVIEDILKLRQEFVELLGFDNYAEYSLQTKMAESPKQVEEFLLDLAKKSKVKAGQDLQQLERYATERLNVDTLEAWDIPYISELLKEDQYHFSDEELKSYFPVDRVIEGLFQLTSRLFGVYVRENQQQQTWHTDVRYFEILNSKEQVIAGFYLDLYARQSKQGGAWMDVCRNRMVTQDSIVTPIAYMTCNAAPPSADRPALFTHDEMVTLFHEFGHGLHHMLTEVAYTSVAGINGVEWDAVESPSQFMENWCWDRQTLLDMSQHYKNGSRLPEELFEKLSGTRTFNSGLQTLRQIEFALFDLRVHCSTENLSEDSVQNILDEVRNQVSVLKPPTWVKFQNSFSHIFAGGYAAGYYSYKWAEVLSADIFSAFEENEESIEKTGQRLKETILSKGGSQPAIDLFIRFRGRKPSIEPLLKQNGMMTVQ